MKIEKKEGSITSVRNKMRTFKKISRKKQTGFTMIELIVVIVIVAMLTTIAVVIFQNHLKRGRDSFRKSEVDTISTLVRLDRVKKEKNNFDLNKNQVLNILKTHSISGIKVEGDYHYFFGYSANKNDFFVVVCGEEEPKFFAKGTPNGIIAVNSSNPLEVCDGSSVPIKERALPLDDNAMSSSLDAYTIYQLS